MLIKLLGNPHIKLNLSTQSLTIEPTDDSSFALIGVGHYAVDFIQSDIVLLVFLGNLRIFQT